MKAYAGVDAYVHIFLTSALAGGEGSAQAPTSLPNRKETPVAIG
jgi:hypothetical protein